MGERWEVERDRFGVSFSGPLEVGECRQVVPAEHAERPRRGIENIAEKMRLGPCWEWPGGPNSEGYGSPTIAGRMVRAHRWVYEALFADVPEGLELDHLCRNPICVNPFHLEAVTHTENVRRGENSKLTRAQVLEIRASPESSRKLAKRYGVSPITIQYARRGITYREPGDVVQARRRVSSEYKGVARDGDRWRAQITIGGKKRWLGRFDTEEEAAAAVATALRRESDDA